MDNFALKWWEISERTIKAKFISPYCVILHQNGVYPKIGKGTWIGHWTVLDGSQGLTIGKNCSIASGVHIYSHSTHRLVAYGEEKLVGAVEIGDNVAIGANSVIHYGSTIESNVVIPSLTVIEPWSIVRNEKIGRSHWQSDPSITETLR